MNTKFEDAVHIEFIDALDRIKRFTGLELRLSEKVALKRIIREVERSNRNTQSPYDQTNTSPEAVCIFLDQYYDLPFRDQGDLSSFLDLKRHVNKEKGYDAMAEFFQLQQDRAYLL